VSDADTFPKPTKPWRLVRKDEVWVFRAMAWLVAVLFIMDRKTFMERFWTTWDHTIGFRIGLTLEEAKKHVNTVDHELVHIWRKEKWGGFIYSTAYVGPSVTIFLPVAAISSIVHVFVEYSWVWTWASCGLVLFFLPLSIGLAYGRFFIEREAYMVQITRAGDAYRSREIQRVVYTLKKNYALTYPVSWMRSWFNLECARRGLAV
jgi:hypothetical protein